MTITGSGFAPNEPLTLQVTHADGGAEAGMGHEMAPLLADADGAFVTAWSIVPADVGSNDFIVRATGTDSSAAVSVFTRVARISTDRSDYQPGQTATISGAAFAPDESVMLQVSHLTGAEDGGAGHEEFAAAADGNGQLVSSW